MEVFIGSGKPPPDVKNFGDAALAKKVIQAAAEGVVKEQVLPYNAVTTFTYQKCARLGIRARQCQDLQEVLMTSVFHPRSIPFGLVVTAEEERELEENGFSREFIWALASSDGKKALVARIEWLRKNVVKYEVPENFSTADHKAMLEELKAIGLEAADAVSYIMALGASGLAPDVMATVSELEKNPLARLSYSGKICSGTQWGIEGLITAVQSSDPARQSCALKALQKSGRAAKSAAPVLKEEYRRLLRDTNKKELRREIVETFSKVAPPTPETAEFYREIFWDGPAGDLYSWEWAVERLMELLGTAELAIRLRIVDIFMEIGEFTPLKFYLPALTSSNAARRGDAIFDLSMEKQEANAPLFFAALHHPRRIFRRRALKAIAKAELKTGSIDDIRLLISWLSHRHPKIRRQAAIALGVQGEKAKYALPFLSAMQNNPDEKKEICEAAAQAIQDIEEAAL